MTETPNNTPESWLQCGALNLVLASGADAGSFLQAQLSCDINALAGNTVQPFAWCSAAGRVRYSGWITGHGQAFLMLLPAGRGEQFISEMQAYIFRARVTLVGAAESGLAMSWQADYVEIDNSSGADQANDIDDTVFVLPGNPVRRIRISRTAKASGESATQSPAAENSEAFILAGIRAAACELPAVLENLFLPQMLNLDMTGGVSFSKGCYPGQEVIARTHHLGHVKRRLLRFQADPGNYSPGTSVLLDSKAVGKIVVAAQAEEHCELLAVVSLSARDSDMLTLDVPGNPKLTQLPLPYRLTERNAET